MGARQSVTRRQLLAAAKPAGVKNYFVEVNPT
jgi:hypothetical protein